MEKNSFCLPRWISQDGRKKSGIPTSAFFQDHPARGEELNDVLQGESDGLQPLDQKADDIEARTDFWSVSGIFIVTLNRASMFTCLTRGPSQYHANVSTLSGGRIRHWMDVLLVSRSEDCWNVDGGGSYQG